MKHRRQLGSTQQVQIGVQAGGGIATALAPAAAAGPIGAGVALVSLAIAAFASRRGPRQKVATTQIVNEIEPLMERNREEYLTGPRTVSSQAQALYNFDALWAELIARCQIPEMGAPGRRCVEERARECTAPEPECWNWFAYYRDPIENDDQVRPDPSAVESIYSQIFQAGGAGGSGGLNLDNAWSAALPVALLLIALAL